MDSSNSSISMVKTGNATQFRCYVTDGMPPPTVTWFKVSYTVY